MTSAKWSISNDHEAGELTLALPDRDDVHERRYQGRQCVRVILVAYCSKTIAQQATQIYPIKRQHSVEFTSS